MKCYNHHTHDAMGICKNCQKGICMDCLIDTGNGLACKESCKENVDSLNRIIDRQVRMYGSTSQALKQRTLFYIAFALFFILMGFQIDNKMLQILFIAMGSLFFIMSIATNRQQKKLE